MLRQFGPQHNSEIIDILQLEEDAERILCWQITARTGCKSKPQFGHQAALSAAQELRGAWRRLEGAASQGYGWRAAGGTYGPGSPLFAFTSEAAARGTESSCLTLPQQPRAFSTVAGTGCRQ